MMARGVQAGSIDKLKAENRMLSATKNDLVRKHAKDMANVREEEQLKFVAERAEVVMP
jgi:hypothetical protein